MIRFQGLPAIVLEHEAVTQGQLDQILAEGQQRVATAIEFAETSPEPEADQLLLDIYAEG